MWVQAIPFIFVHVACLGIFLPQVEFTTTACILLVVNYAVRVWGLTAGYHRYFSHRAYKTSRTFQFILALLGCSALQKGPIWWAGHHRHHHLHSDTEEDIHSPIVDSFWHSHVGWIFTKTWEQTNWRNMHDFAKYPELRWLEKHHWWPGVGLAVLCYLVGGWSGLFWGFFVSTVAVYHVTFFINSLCHIWGRRRYQTTDLSRNNFFLALLTFGEGWHNNHHHYQSSANQGFFWWEVDISFYVLRVLSWFGIVWDLRLPPKNKQFPDQDQPQGDHFVEPAKPDKLASKADLLLPPISAQSVAAAAQAVVEPVMAVAQSARESVAAAAYIMGETVAAAAVSARESVAAAALVASESVVSAAHSAKESIVAAAQVASESVVAAAHSAVPTATVVALVAVPMVTFFQTVASQST